MTKFQSIFEDYINILKRFEDVLKEPESDIVRDSAIIRFELTFDLMWKLEKAFLEEYHNVSCSSPRNCMKEAFRLGIIDYDDFWLDMINLRNEAVHTYNEILSKRLYKKLPKTLNFFKKFYKAIKKELK